MNVIPFERSVGRFLLKLISDAFPWLSCALIDSRFLSNNIRKVPYKISFLDYGEYNGWISTQMVSNQKVAYASCIHVMYSLLKYGRWVMAMDIKLSLVLYLGSVIFS